MDRQATARTRSWLVRSLWLGVLLGWRLLTAHAEVLVLKSGERFTGSVVQDGPLEVIFDSTTAGRLTVPLAAVERIERDDLPGPVQTEAEPAPEQLFRAAPSAAENPPEPSPPLAPVAPPPAVPPHSVARFYWDGRLQYELSNRVALRDPFVPDSLWVDERFQLRARIGVKLAVDGAVFASRDGLPPVENGVELRTFKILTQGQIGIWRTNNFKMELGLIGHNFYLTSLYYQLPDLPHFGDLTFGYFTAPQSLDNVMSYGSLMFLEPGSPVGAFSPGSRTGVEWAHRFYNRRMTATAGVFSVGQNPSLNFGDASSALAQPMVRVTGLPLAGEERWLHLGISDSLVISSEDGIQYKARPESRLAPFLVNTGSIDARKANIGGLEVAFASGPLLIQSEYLNAYVLRDGPDSTFKGVYIAAGWMLTGENRPYDRVAGMPTRVQPRHPLWGPNRGWGAWEVGGRCSYLDLTDETVNGGQMKIFLPGVNWYWNQYIRWQFNYGFARVEGGPTPGNLHFFEARFESQF